MTPSTLLAQAAVAEREAHALFAKIEVARGGSTGALIPAGFGPEAERASDLRRRARKLRADAAATSVTGRESLRTPSERPVPVKPVYKEVLVERERAMAIITTSWKFGVNVDATCAAITDGTAAAKFKHHHEVEALARQIAEASK